MTLPPVPVLGFTHDGFESGSFTLNGDPAEYWDWDRDDDDEAEGPACWGSVEAFGRITVSKACRVADGLREAVHHQQYRDWMDDYGGEFDADESAIEYRDVSFRCILADLTDADLKRGAFPAMDDLVDISLENGCAWIEVKTWLDPDLFTHDSVKSLLTPLLNVYGGKAWFVQWDENYGPNLCSVTASVPTRPRTQISKLYQTGCEMRDLLNAVTTSPLTAERALALVVSGAARSLIGQSEGSAFEVKGSPYILKGEHGKHELAKDVSAMANAHGGLILIGFVTADSDSGERVTNVRGFRPGMVRKNQYRAVIDQLVYPPVEGLRLEMAKVGDTEQSVFAIYVPEQLPELMPFVVRGTKIAGKHSKSYFAVYERRDDTTLPMSTERLHTFMTVGRALLRGDTKIADTESH